MLSSVQIAEYKELANDIGHDLLGGTQDLDSLLGEKGLDYLNMPQVFFSFIDDITFMCEVCNWWCEAGDYAEDTTDEICSDCGDE